MKVFKKSRKFTKAEKSLLPILIREAEYVKRASLILCDMMESSEESDWIRCEKEIKQYEVKGDAMIAEFYSAFYDRMIPISVRNDLQLMALRIAVFMDQINSAAKSVLLYKPESIGPQFVDMARYIDRAADAILQIIKELDDISANFTSITHQCETISELEHVTDEVYEEYVSELFTTETNPFTLIKNKNMAEVFEATTDAAKDFSDHIRMFQLRFL